MICALVICTLLHGSGTQCDLEKPPELVPLPPVLAATWAECRDAARDLRRLTPANLRIVRFEYYTPKPTQTQTANGEQ